MRHNRRDSATITSLKSQLQAAVTANNFEKIIELALKIQKQELENFNALADLGYAYFALKRNGEALRVFAAVLQLRENFRKRSDAAKLAESAAIGEYAYEMMVLTKKAIVRTSKELVKTAYTNGEFERAFSLIDQVPEYEGADEDFEFLELAAVVAKKAKNKPAAIEFLKKITDNDKSISTPFYQPALYYLGRLYRRLGSNADAVASFTKILESKNVASSTFHIAALYDLGLLHYQAADYALARDRFLEIVENDSASPQFYQNALYYLGMVYCELGERDNKLQLLEAGVGCFQTLSTTTFQTDFPEAFAKALETLEAIKLQLVKEYEVLGLNAGYRESHAEAEEYFSCALRHDENHLCSIKHRGIARYFLGEKYSDAKVDLEKAVSSDAEDMETRVYLGFVECALGNYQRGEELLADWRLLKNFETDLLATAIYHNLGNAYFYLRQFNEAVFYFTKRIGDENDKQKLNKGSGNKHCLQLRAAAYQHLGQLGNAIKDYETLLHKIKLNPDERLQIETKKADLEKRLKNCKEGLQQLLGHILKLEAAETFFHGSCKTIDAQFESMKESLPADYAKDFYALEMRWLKARIASTEDRVLRGELQRRADITAGEIERRAEGEGNRFRTSGIRPPLASPHFGGKEAETPVMYRSSDFFNPLAPDVSASTRVPTPRVTELRIRSEKNALSKRIRALRLEAPAVSPSTILTPAADKTAAGGALPESLQATQRKNIGDRTAKELDAMIGGVAGRLFSPVNTPSAEPQPQLEVRGRALGSGSGLFDGAARRVKGGSHTAPARSSTPDTIIYNPMYLGRSPSPITTPQSRAEQNRRGIRRYAPEVKHWLARALQNAGVFSTRRDQNVVTTDNPLLLSREMKK